MIQAIKIFLVTFVVVLVVNQLFYGACFKSYCLSAAFPKVAIIATIISWFLYYAGKDDENN